MVHLLVDSSLGSEWDFCLSSQSVEYYIGKPIKRVFYFLNYRAIVFVKSQLQLSNYRWIDIQTRSFRNRVQLSILIHYDSQKQS